MKVVITIDKIGEPIEDRIRKKLKANKMPECLGRMSPPLVTNTITVDDSTVFKTKGSIPSENIVLESVHDIVRYQKYDDDLTYNRSVLDIDGRNFIEATKESMADSYVRHLSACYKCNYTDLCDKITYHYMKTIILMEGL